MAGAFSESRLGLAEIYRPYMKRLREVRRKKPKKDQDPLVRPTIPYPEIKPITIPVEELLQLEEKYLGLYVSSHPLNHINVVPVGTSEITDIVEEGVPANVVLLTVIDSVQEKTTRRGARMAVVTMQDLSASVEMIVFPRELAKVPEGVLEKGNIVKVRGQFQVREGKGQFVARTIELCS